MNLTKSLFSITAIGLLSFSSMAKELSPITVVATRTSQTVDESLSTVSVFSREDIEASQAINLTDILKKQAGLNITSQGALGKIQSVFMRGTGAGHVLVLIDGIRVSSATTGEFAWQNLLADQIEKVEVVYGPRTSLYGSDAIGGVISITTRESKKTTASVSYGSYNTSQTNITTAGGENWKYSLSAGYLATDGYPTRDSDKEDHGHKLSHFSATLKNQINSDTSVEAKINHSQGSNQHDSSTGDSKTKNQVISATLNNALNDMWNQKLVLGHSVDEYTSYSPTTPSTITTNRNSASWQHDLFIEQHTTTVGIDYWKDDATKDNSGLIDKSIDNTAIFFQQQWNMTRDSIIINARSDEHSESGTEATGSLAWGHSFGKNRLILSYATAFKAPSINDLFWPYSTSTYSGTTYITQGNLNVKPESSKTTEVIWKTKPTKNLTWNTSIYQTEIDDLIKWNSTLTAASEYTYVPTNINSASITGFESSISYLINDWKLDANVTFLNARNNETGKQLDRRAKKRLNTTLTRYLGNKQLSLEVLTESSRNDRNAAVTLDAYMLMNILYSHAISKELKWNLRLNNLTKTDYVLASGPSGDYRTPGRTAQIGLNYTF